MREFSCCRERLYCSKVKTAAFLVPLNCTQKLQHNAGNLLWKHGFSVGLVWSVESWCLIFEKLVSCCCRCRCCCCRAVGDSSRLPDPVSVETAERSWECACDEWGKAKKKVLTFPLWRGKIIRGGKQRQGLSQHMLQ